MGMDVRWRDEERTILVWTMQGRWVWREFDAAWQQKTWLQDSVSHPVYHLFDLREVTLYPADFVRRVRGRYSDPHPMTVLRVVVGADRWIQVFYNMFTMLYYPQLEAHFFDYMDEALDFIEAHKRGISIPGS